MWHLNVRIGEHIGVSPLTKKQVKPENSSVADHLLFCNHSAPYDDFNTLTPENKRFLLELKESLLIRDIHHLWIGTLYRHHCTYSTGPSNIFVGILFVLLVTTFFLLDGLFFIWSCVSVWAPLFALMILFNLLSSWSWD